MSTVRAGLRLLGLALHGEGTRVAVGLGLLVGSTVAALLQPWPLKLVIDTVLGDQPPPAALAMPSKMAQLGVLVAAMIGLQAIVGVLSMLGTNIVIRAALRMVFACDVRSSSISRRSRWRSTIRPGSETRCTAWPGTPTPCRRCSTTRSSPPRPRR